MNKVKKFWNDQASQYQGETQATQPDYYSFMIEIKALATHMTSDQEVIEYGCGNGYAMQQVFKTVALKSYKGVDYSEEMIKTAKSTSPETKQKWLQPSNTVNYEVGDVTKHTPQESYDMAITDRCLINLASHEEQLLAAQNIHSTLRPGGTYLMFECSKKSLANINQVRAQFDLPEIMERWHNCYLDEDRFLKDISPYFEVEHIESPISTYFLVSRTVNAVVGLAEGHIDYFSKINETAANLPAEGDYAPLKLFVLRKKEV
jgi:SAM-dependent methyltransferase